MENIENNPVAGPTETSTHSIPMRDTSTGAHDDRPVSRETPENWGRDKVSDREHDRSSRLHEQLRKNWDRQARKEQLENDDESSSAREYQQKVARDTGVEIPDIPTETPTQAPSQVADQAPVAWDKASKKEWANLPDNIKQQVLKRERDMDRGVKQLKTQYQQVDQLGQKHRHVFNQLAQTRGWNPVQSAEVAVSTMGALVDPNMTLQAQADVLQLIHQMGLPTILTAQQQHQQVQAMDPQQRAYLELDQRVQNLQRHNEEQVVRHRYNDSSNTLTAFTNSLSAEDQQFMKAQGMEDFIAKNWTLPFEAPAQEKHAHLKHWLEAGKWAHSGIRAYLQKKANSKQEKQAHLEKAKQHQYRGSLPPSGSADGEVRRSSNGAKKGPTPMRDSIYAAIKELSDR